MQGFSRTKTSFLIAVLVLMWGLIWPTTKIALNDSPPILFAGMRCCLGGLLLILFSIRNYKNLRLKQYGHVYAISALLNAVLYYTFQNIGIEYMSSGLFAVLVFIQPVLVGVFSWLWLGEPMSRAKIAGLILGFVGVATISMESLFGRISIAGLLFAFATALSWALGTVYTKTAVAKVDAMWLAAVQFFVGGLVITGIGTFTERWSSIHFSSLSYWGCLIYGTIFGVSIGWVIYFVLVRHIDASKVASSTFLIPLISVFVGTVFLHEAFTIYLLVGLVLIVLGIYFVNKRPGKDTPNDGARQHSLAANSDLEASVTK